MATLVQDLRYGIRMLLKSPGFTAVALVTLALGIGANAAIFSVVNGVLLKPLPYEDPDRLVKVFGTRPSFDSGPFSDGDFLDYREQNGVFQQSAGYQDWEVDLTGAGESERISCAWVSASFFELLGARAARGRTLLPDEEQPGRDNVAAISHSLWVRRFGAAPGLIGGSIALDGRSYTVVGILPASFDFPKGTQVWLPATFRRANRSANRFQVIARLKPGVSLAAARTDLEGIAKRLERAYPETNAHTGVRLIPLRETVVKNLRTSLLVLLGAVGFVLLIGCANIANLMLVRAAARQREIAVRQALGAGRARIIRQFLTESLLLALVGGLLGLLLALWLIDLLPLIGPPNLPRLSEIGLDGTVFGFTCVVSLAAGVLFGILPALRAPGANLIETLKEGGRTSSRGLAASGTRNLLAVAEMALALVLSIGAGLLIRSFLLVRGINPGFNPEGLLTLRVSLPESRYRDAFRKAAFYREALRRLRQLPSVRSAGATQCLPFSCFGWSTEVTVEGRGPGPSGRPPLWYHRAVSPDYFQAMEIPLLEGRLFTERDDEGSPLVAIVSTRVAREFFPDGHAIGKRISLANSGRWWEIVGVVGDVKNFLLESPGTPNLYLSYLQAPEMSAQMSLVVRSSSDPSKLSALARQQIQAVDQDVPVASVCTMDEYLGGATAMRRFQTGLLGSFAGLAVLLAMVGIYSVVAYSVAQRTHELGVRMALGAQQADVLKLVLGQGMALTLLGVATGLAGAAALTRLLSGLLHGVRPGDPATFLGVPLVFGAVALAASYIPARRATRVDPITALRYE